MNLDKHDLFRNAVPGFVFMIVILSFYAVTGRLDAINQNQGALLGLVAGFPLGFIIHSLYRIIFHIWSGEQAALEEEDAQLVSDEIFQGDNKEKAHFLWFHMSQNQPWKGRIDFLYSYIHALGSSVLAIFLALGFMFTIKYPICYVLFCSGYPKVMRIILTAFIWVLIAVIFYAGRKHVKDSCKISREVFFKINKDKLIGNE